MDVARYFSQIVIPGVGIEGQQALANAKVLVIGAGGLGCPVLSYLTSSGIGTIGVVDDDIVELKNLHRQVLYDESDVQQLKVIVAKEKLMQQNSTVSINAYPERLNPVNVKSIISDYDIVVDCSDNIATRYLIDDISRQLNKPFVYGAVRQMEGQVSVFNYRDGPCFAELFPDKKDFEGQPDCATAGILGYVVGLIGCLQVNEVIKMILKMDGVLSGEILSIDLGTMNFRKFKIKQNNN